MARLYQKINGEAVPLGGGGGGSVAIDNVTITENSDDEIQVATTLTSKINQLNNSASDMGKVLTANGDGTAEWDDVLVPIDYETITKNGDGELQVSSMPYDNTESGLTADNVQGAIDEINSNLDDLDATVKAPKHAKLLFSGTAELNTVYDLNETLNPFDTLPTMYLIRIGAGSDWYNANVFLIVGPGTIDQVTTFPIGVKSGDANSVGIITIQILAGNKTFKVTKNTTAHKVRQIYKLSEYTAV